MPDAVQDGVETPFPLALGSSAPAPQPPRRPAPRVRHRLRKAPHRLRSAKTTPCLPLAHGQIAAASGGGKGRLNTWLIEGHTHYSHERSQLQPLTRTVDANCPFRTDFPKRGVIAARHRDYGGRSSRPRPQPQMRIELRGSARPGRPAPSARMDAVDTDF